ncbi:MAG: class I SAM-dependent methyltransferase [Bacteroidota bacterium]
MNDTKILDVPSAYSELVRKSVEIGFTMPSDIHIGNLLKTLVASKPSAHILELGTGMGLSLSWMVAGMDGSSRLITVDNDLKLCHIAKKYFGNDQRVDIVCEDASMWLKNYTGEAFDLIFADAWPGKYSDIDKTLDLLKPNGFYVIDDMSHQPNWPEGHQLHVMDLIGYLEEREDFNVTKMDWSTGVIIAVKTKTTSK